ncbi:uncharacterized protein PFL1_06218 [Pseudozyma flocculosa PF-1]|uniref:CID domain-containing protein n=2 Tax=Pseudozyma flocculosa TaxID=84751 RepID=A0A5C3F703_9BASI|nr:uncharacterized protein PFL1_06218 [Pseudozyma flocculosa PF-1]EPQ26283.1 hypothetical protein PFL1_06218 [Pseudozyma flocculosa PF-1]SPO40244.1 uncharacterized protein PSFLO_05726 [Pseudozyma flocculosa]
MDPFQLRLNFLSTLKRLSASQSSIHASLSFLTQHCHAPASVDDLWSCLMDTCATSSLNTRINLLFLISSLFTDDSLSTPAVRAAYTPLLHRDADRLVHLMLPPDRWEAVLNLDATTRVLETWRTKMVLDPNDVDRLVALVESVRAQLYRLPKEQRGKRQGWSEQEVVRRVEEDRERHKRLRENLWILPRTSTSQSILFGIEPHQINPLFLVDSKPSAGPTDGDGDGDGDGDAKVATTASTMPRTAHDLDFSQAWEQTSEWNSDDDDLIADENEKLVLPPVSDAWC